MRLNTLFYLALVAGAASACQYNTVDPGPSPLPVPIPVPTATSAPTPSPVNTPTPAPTPAPTPSALPMPSPRPSTAANTEVCAPTKSLTGVDVSDADVNTEWANVQKSGQSFAFVKATEGMTFESPTFAADWPQIKANGLIRGAYHYFRPADDALTQAKFFLSVVGTLSANDLPPVLDWEITDGVSAAVARQAALVWLAAVESATGRTPMIYVDPTFWNSLGNPAQFARYPLYIANYEVTCPSIPPPWTTWTFWQQGFRSVNGITTSSVDFDIFNGADAEMNVFMAAN